MNINLIKRLFDSLSSAVDEAFISSIEPLTLRFAVSIGGITAKSWSQRGASERAVTMLQLEIKKSEK